MANRNPKPVKVTNVDTRFKPGKDWNGNGKGRPPKSQCVSSLLRELLLGNPVEITAKWKVSPTGAMMVAMAMFAKMGRGDMTAVKEGLDRVEGKVAQPVTGEGGGPVKVDIDVKTKILSAISRLSTGEEQGKGD